MEDARGSARARKRRLTIPAAAMGMVLKEKKFFDLGLGATALQAGGGLIIVDSVVEIPEGTGESERSGRRCTAVWLGMRYRIYRDSQGTASGSNESEVVRIIVYHDKQANGATAAAADLLEDDDFLGFNNLSNSGRFTTLMDRTHDLVPASGGDTVAGTASQTHQWFKTIDIPLEFSDPAGAITSLRSSNIGIAAWSTSVGAQIRLKFRTRFVG